MKFKTFLQSLTEKSAQDNTDLKILIAKNAIPISTLMMDRLGYSYEDSAWHMTSSQYLPALKKLQNSKKQISAFTKGSNQLMKLPSNPTVLVKLEGNVVIEADSDMWTSIDKQGRRWINLSASSASNGTIFSEKLAFYIEGIKQRIFNDMLYYDIPGGIDSLSAIKDMTKAERNRLYKIYITEVEKYLQKDGYKLLNKHLKKNITYNYNEVVINKFKIIGAYSLGNDTQKEEIISSKIKYLGEFNLEDLEKLK